ncbi:MAG: hypothetical protein P0S94_02875 [Simkaniaceae bacterium]|nr:hypothetical protein [Simkaniaceae bacterium]
MNKCLLSLAFTTFLLAQRPPAHFQGTLLEFSTYHTPVGALDFQPFFYGIYEYGEYTDNWKVDKQPSRWEIQGQYYIETGLLDPWFDATLILNNYYKMQGSQKSAALGDTFLELGYQICEQSKTYLGPSLRLILQQGFPTGKFNQLEPNKIETDITGTGTYETALIFVTQQNVNSPAVNWGYNTALGYQYFYPTNVLGMNAYGGGFGTSGTVNPGNQFYFALGLQFEITQNWSFINDFQYTHLEADTFTGNPGINPDGTPATVGGPSSDIFLLAPGFAYTIDNWLGISFGSWFTVAGRNTEAFVSSILTIAFSF